MKNYYHYCAVDEFHGQKLITALIKIIGQNYKPQKEKKWRRHWVDSSAFVQFSIEITCEI